ncbi:hypothetical protein KUC58_07090 [Pseudomonas aeruginosa]|nr:hypothetical protein [Pseudomonas aeruginosa]MCV0130875.1 hypothetical protein [Pseudomonas aeruginosa]
MEPRAIRHINLATGPHNEPSYEWVDNAVNYLDKSGDIAFAGRLKGALRQHRHISASPEKKHHSFSIPKNLNRRFQEIAKNKKVSMNELFIDALEDLIKTTTKHNEVEKKLNEAIKHEKERANQVIKSSKIEFEAAIAHIKTLAEQLSKWELSMDSHNPEYDGDQETLDAATKKITKPIEEDLKRLITKNSLMAPRES